MKDNKDIFLKILLAFHKHGILNEVILIGSWVLPIYRHYFSETPEIPILRTADVDFLIPHQSKPASRIDIPKILKTFDFEEQFSLIGHYSKFIHPDLEVEFLYPEIGRKSITAKLVKEYNITAQPLRYLYIIQNHTLTVKYMDIPVKVPEPAVFSLLKFLLTIKRRKPDKIKKDLKTAVELTDFLLTQSDQVEKFIQIYNEMPKTWQNKIKPIIKENCEELFYIIVQ